MTDQTILLVEDNEDDVELALHALHRGRIPNRIVTVPNGERALDYLFRTGAYADRDPDEGPALVLLDIKLPGISGFDVLRHLRGDRDTKIIPTVMLTASEDESDVVKCYELGANSYICKPLDIAQFSEVVGEIGLHLLSANQPPSA
jgi:two-component system response regulator